MTKGSKYGHKAGDITHEQYYPPRSNIFLITNVGRLASKKKPLYPPVCTKVARDLVASLYRYMSDEGLDKMPPKNKGLSVLRESLEAESIQEAG